MKSVYAEVGASLQQIGGDLPDGWIAMQGERPSPEHVAQADGTWVIPAKTEEQLRAEWKQERAAAVAAITVEVDGMVFQGDETSQTRMSRSLSVMNDDETIRWVLADNTPAQVSKTQLIEALRLAGAEQARLWVQS